MADKQFPLSLKFSADASQAKKAASGVEQSLQRIGTAAQAGAREATAALNSIHAPKAVPIDASAAGLIAEARAATAALNSIKSPKPITIDVRAEQARLVKGILSDIETPAERLAGRISTLNALFADGALTQSQYHRALSAYRAEAAGAERATTGLASAVGLAVNGFIAFQVALAAGSLVRTTAAVQNLETRLQGVTAKTGDYAGAVAFLDVLTARHHKTISDMAGGYANLLALEESGIVTRREAQQITEGLSNAQSFLGASGEQLKQVMFGLGQALSSPVVHAEELNQVMEPLPGLLAKMDKAAGLPAGGFRQLVNEGKITSEMFKTVLVRALADFEGAAERAGGNITARFADVRREWELLARAAEKPITFVIDISGGIAEWVLQKSRQAGEFWGDQFKGVESAWNRTFGFSDAEKAVFNQREISRQLADRATALQGAAGSIKSASELLQEAAAKYRVPASLIESIAKQESGLSHLKPGTDQVQRSGAGALGLMGVKPGTASQYGLDAKDQAQNAEAGVRYFSEMLALARKQFADDATAIAAALAMYNEGPGNFAKRGGLANLPAETDKYIKDVMGRWQTADIAGIAFDLDAYQRNLKDAEASQSASLARQVSNAQNAAQAQAERAKTTLAQTELEIEKRRQDRAAQLFGLPELQRQSRKPELDRQAAEDAKTLANARLAADQAAIASQESLAQAQLRALQAERDHAAEYGKTAAEREQITSRIEDAQSRLTQLAEQRHQVEIRGETEITRALGEEAKARDEASIALADILQRQVRAQEQLASSRAQNVQARVTAGVLAETEARKELNAIYGQAAAAIQPVRDQLQQMNAEGRDPALAQAAVEAETAWLHFAASVRTPLEQLGQTWADVTGRMEQASTQWMDGLSQQLTDLVTTGKADFRGLAQSILADMVKIEIEGGLSRLMQGGQWSANGGLLSSIGSWFGASGSSAGYSLAQPNIGYAGMGPVLPAAEAAARGIPVSAIPGSSGISTLSAASGLSGLFSAGSASAYVLSSSGTLIPLMEGGIGGLATKGLLSAGVGMSSAAAIGSGLAAAAGPGAIAGLAAQFLGLRGDNAIANMVAPTVGAVGGGIGGAAMGTILGVAGGPVGAVIGAIVGSLASMLFHSAKPAAGAETIFGRNNTSELGFTREHAGGQLEALKTLGAGVAENMRQMEATFGVELGSLRVGAEQHYKDFLIAGYDATGKFAEITAAFTEDDMKDAVDQFLAAVLHRKSVLKQVDDALLRSAIEQGQTLTAIGENYARVAGIRRIDGERTELADTLARQAARYQRQLAAVREFASPAMLGTETNKLNEGWQRKFDALAHDARSALDQLSGIGESAAYQLQAIDEQIQQVRTKDLELQRAAKSSRGRLSHTPLTEAQLDDARAAAVAKLRDNVLSTMHGLAGEAIPLADRLANVHRQFAQIRDGAEELGISLDAVAWAEAKAAEAARTALTSGATEHVKTSIQDIMDAIAGPAATITRLSADIASGQSQLQMLALGGDTVEMEVKAGEIVNLIVKRHDLEISQLHAQIAAAGQLKGVIDGLKLSNISPLRPSRKMAEARTQYHEALVSAQTGDAVAIAKYTQISQAYLQQLRSYDPGTAYTQTFSAVTADMADIAERFGAGSDDMTDLQRRSLSVLEGIQKLLEQYASKNPSMPTASHLQTIPTSAEIADAFTAALTAGLQGAFDLAARKRVGWKA